MPSSQSGLQALDFEWSHLYRGKRLDGPTHEIIFSIPFSVLTSVFNEHVQRQESTDQFNAALKQGADSQSELVSAMVERLSDRVGESSNRPEKKAKTSTGVA